MDESERFVCPICGERSAFQSSCMRCDEPMLDAGKVAPWQLTQSQRPQGMDGEPPPTVLRSIVASLLFLAATVASIAWGSNLLGTAGVFLGPFALLAVIFGALMAYFGAVDARRSLAEIAKMRAVPLRKASETGDGVVTRIVGSTKTILPAIPSKGPTSLAFVERRVISSERGDASPTIQERSSGGEFVLDDGSGLVAIVRCEYFEIVGGVRAGNQTIIPEGARVEVVGHARWDVAHESSSVHHARSAARVVRIEGTPERPVQLRVLQIDERPLESPQGQATASSGPPEAVFGAAPIETGVRVSLGAAQTAGSARREDEVVASEVRADRAPLE
ncbi:MAG: hypothetical protein Q8Q09_17220 [Deltaproteobacteria bacterium]|nr:hypothetical protein [Deltaproteobacteria bacterium]